MLQFLVKLDCWIERVLRWFSIGCIVILAVVFANPYASKSRHISSQKIAQLRLKNPGPKNRIFNVGINYKKVYFEFIR